MSLETEIQRIIEEKPRRLTKKNAPCIADIRGKRLAACPLVYIE